MKNIACGIAVLACLGVSASAITRVGDSSELFLTGTASVRTDDNIFLNDLDQVDDTIVELAPGVEYSFGQGAQMSGSFKAAETFSRYLDNNNLDDELLSSSFKVGYDDAKLKLSFDASYDELNQSTRDIRGTNLVRRDVIASHADSQISVTEKTSTGLGVSYNDTDYKDSDYIDIQEIAVPFNYFYAISEKVDLSAGLRYRKTSLGENAGDSSDYYYNVGARGEFTPKFSGFFSVGYNQRKPERGDDESSIGANASFAYDVTEKTSIGLDLSNDYTTSAEGISQKTFSVAPSVTAKLSSQWEASFGLTYQKLEYFSGRDDEYLDARVGLAYRLNENASLSAGYNYRSNDSNVTYVDGAGRTRTGDFDNNVITVAASVRF